MGCEQSTIENISQNQIKKTLNCEKEIVQGIKIGGVINGCLFKNLLSLNFFF
jgi:hypothetical protein